MLLFPDQSRPTVTVNMTLLVGSRHEGYGEAGMAHLLEHMLFKGTPTHPNIPQALQDRGARFNGTTTPDRTNYFETVPASNEPGVLPPPGGRPVGAQSYQASSSGHGVHRGTERVRAQ